MQFRFVPSAAIALSLALGCQGRLDISETVGGGDAGLPSRTPCQDGLQSGAESDIDCGGDCAPCVTDASCARHADCRSGVCRAGLCAEATCEDGIRNGDEADVDCGGATCERCLSRACNCATSATLTPLECDETGGRLDYQIDPQITPNGDAAAFGLCHYDGDAVTTCYTYRWTLAGGTEALPGQVLAGASGDGSTLLLQHYDEGTLSLHQGSGDEVAVSVTPGAMLSRDGNSIVGTPPSDAGPEALVRWMAGTLEQLGTFQEFGSNQWHLTDMTPDASVVIGFLDSPSGDIPLRWDATRGLHALGGLPADVTGARPVTISRDGSTIAGVTTSSGLNREIFRFRDEDGFDTLGPAHSISTDVGRVRLSNDGAVVVATGGYPSESSSAALRWAPDGTRVLMYDGTASDMTLDGAIVVGAGSSAAGYLWKESAVGEFPSTANGDFSVSDMLRASGADLTGWSFGAPTNISEDGRVLFGRATCGGVATYYRWVLPQ